MRAEGDEQFVAPENMNNDNNSLRSNIIGFINPVYAKKSRSDARFATCTLEVGTQETKLRADPNVLSQASYFDELLTDTNKNGTLYLPDLDSDAVGLLIDYLYTGTITCMELRTLQNVLVAARKFGLDEVKTTCLEKLTANLVNDNCLEIRAFAKWNKFETLRKAACDFMKNNFTTLTNSNEFVNLEFADVEEMISSCNRNVTTDEVIFKAILRWVKHDQSRRESHVYGLLTHVNLVGLFTESPELVMESFEGEQSENVLQGKLCQKMYHDMVVQLARKSVKRQQLRESESQSSGNYGTSEPAHPNLNSDSTMNSSQATKRSRLDRPTSESLTEEIDINGISGPSNQRPKRKPQTSTKKNRNSRENSAPKKSTPPVDQHKITDKTFVYIDKFVDKYYLNGYIFESDSMYPLGAIKRPRKWGSLAYREGKIFHIGGTFTNNNTGQDSTQPCKIVNVYREDSFAVYENDNLDLLEAKQNAGVCICGDYLYVTGGAGGSDGRSDTNGVERLHLNRRLAQSKWEEMERRMEYIRATHGVAVLGDKIYAFGGVGLPVDRINPSPKDKAVDLKSAEYFDPSHIAPGDDQPDWKLIAEMNHKRPYVMSGVLDNKIYAIGGSIACYSTELRAKLSSVEYYDPIYNRWTLCAPMTTCRSSGAIVVQDPLMYVIGGDKSSDPTMEVYDHRINKWTKLDWPTNLSKTAEFSSTIVIDWIYPKPAVSRA